MGRRTTDGTPCTLCPRVEEWKKTTEHRITAYLKSAAACRQPQWDRRAHLLPRRRARQPRDRRRRGGRRFRRLLLCQRAAQPGEQRGRVRGALTGALQLAAGGAQRVVSCAQRRRVLQPVQLQRRERLQLQLKGK